VQFCSEFEGVESPPAGQFTAGESAFAVAPGPLGGHGKARDEVVAAGAVGEVAAAVAAALELAEFVTE